MKSVFDASTGVEAYMMKNLLATYDIESDVFGEHLQGGVGDLQAIGIVRVMVDADDFDRAKEVVREWESIEVEPITDGKPATKSRGFLYFFLGCLVGAVCMFGLFNSPVTSQGIDYDGDGILEETWIYNGQILRRAEYDRDDNGEPDEIYYYDLNALIKTAKFDYDFDGVFEGSSQYRDGNTSRISYDFDEDGFSEYRETYNSFGVLTTSSFYEATTKNLKKTQYYDGGVLIVKAKLDTNNDGQLDTQYHYDRFEEIKSANEN